MLPLSLLNAAQNRPMLVELKNGETFNGHLVNCDNFMNITLREVYQTSADADRFWKLKECYIRGSTIKYLRIPDKLLDEVKEEQNRTREANKGSRGGAGGGARGGRGAPTRGMFLCIVTTAFPDEDDPGRGGARGGPNINILQNDGKISDDSYDVLKSAPVLYCSVPLLATLALAALDFSFQVTHGGNENYFFRDNLTSAQVLLTSANSSSSLKRLVVAMPAGNSGALAYFLSLDNSTSGSNLTVTLQNNTQQITTDDFDNVGIQANLNFTGNATLGVTVAGAVRAMRDYVEGSETMHEIFNYTLASYNSSSVQLHRQWINATGSGAYKTADFYLNAVSGAQLNVTPGNNGTYTPPTVNILVDETGSGILQMRFLTNETSLTGLSPPDLFLSEGSGNDSALNTALTGLANGTSQIAQQVSFLTYEDTFVAGGWRFLTNFGRDSMIALRLLMPTLTPEAIEASIGSVIERVNTTGALCHEEILGKPTNSSRNSPSQTYNLHLWSDLGNQPFYDKMTGTGTGLGHIAFDINTALVPASLRATARLARAGVIGNSVSNVTLENGTACDTNSTLADVADSIAAVWEEKALPFFKVTLDGASAEARLQNFVNKANLSEALLNDTTNATEASNKFFYALSLMEDGSPVQVLHSDLGFNLLYDNNVSQELLQRVVEVLQPYPWGLLTSIGMVIANPAYDSNTTNIEVLNNAAYHGTVIWFTLTLLFYVNSLISFQVVAARHNGCRSSAPTRLLRKQL
ncbi:hypothetical protein A7U60_g7143 [Sanghuangporus baumii]|uniref:Sm domain-containing protein n=1 Tax=Sanghuangporus baumii TaxID=108892 RepID=A0A9Q5HTR9_SANBA|nr:hypothetical protein A7U60_g7143 [Sanghuangporus baumii]